MRCDNFELVKLTDCVTLIKGFQQDCNMFVIAGSEKALLVDTGMGSGDLKKVLAFIVPGKPVFVVNTHCHSDHCCGNDQFPEVYLHPNCFADADNAAEERKTLVTDDKPIDCTHYDYKYIPAEEGKRFDLGGKTVEVIETPGHTPGDLSFLLVEDRLLFVGDLLDGKGHGLHMLAYTENVEFSTVSIEVYLKSLLKVKDLSDRFDQILSGHYEGMMGKTYLDQTIDLCQSILAGTVKAYRPNLPDPYGCIACWKAETEDTSILYQDEVVREKSWPKDLIHQAKTVGDGVTLLYGIPVECCCYLIEGSKSAMVIDTGLGSVDMRREIELLTDKPYIVVNTHGHGDHSGANLYFDEVWMNPEERADAEGFLELNKTVLSPEDVSRIEELLKTRKPVIHDLHDGDTFDLGDRTITAITVPGHSAGSTAFLDSKTGLLFSGDLAVRSMDILLTVPSALTIEVYAQSLRKVLALGDRIGGLRTGHDIHTLKPTFLADALAVCERILNGEEGEDVLLPPAFVNRNAKRFPGRGFAVSYRQEKIR
jgi:hydroxyacylglutathione hydrolase